MVAREDGTLATITDVAALAKVSIKTVSRVLNGEPHVSAALQVRVHTAVETLDYRPNQAARRLAGGKSYLIAYLYNNPTPSYIAAIQSGAAWRCRELGYHLVVEPVALAGAARFTAIEALTATLKPDGAFLTPPLSDDPELLAELERLQLNIVRIAGGTHAFGRNFATPERDGGHMVTRHLLDLGHRRIAMIGPPGLHQAALERVEGYRAALREAGLPVRDMWITQGEFDVASGLACAGKLLDAEEPPTAIFAANDEMALGAMMAARQRNLSVPGQLSVVGFDDTPASRSAWPPLTTVRQPLEDMGRAVIDALIDTDGRRAPELNFELVVRESSAPPPR